MKIGIDFTSYDGLYQGSKSRLIELYKRIVQLDKKNEFFLFLNKTNELEFEHPEFGNNNVSLVKLENSIIKYVIDFPNLVKKYKIDILHTQYIIPFSVKSKTIVTIHDVLFEDFPQYFGLFFKLRSKLLFKYAALKADSIITVSEYSKSKIIKHYKINPSKITVVYNGGGKYFDSETTKCLDNYLLTVGRLDKRKNYENLILAFQQVVTKKELIIVGQGDSSYKKKLLSLDLTKRVKILTDINDIQLANLYGNAYLFVYPSFAEGFGMPIVEAMESGLPIIASNKTAIPEVLADAALYFNPHNLNDIIKCINQILNNAELRKNLQLKASQRVKKYSWDESAKSMLNVLGNL